MAWKGGRERRPAGVGMREGFMKEGCGMGSDKHTSKDKEQRRAERINQTLERRVSSMV